MLKLDFYYRVVFVVIGGNMDGCVVKDLIIEFNLIKMFCFDVDKFVWYNLFCLLKDEVLIDVQWFVIVDDYMKCIGFLEMYFRCYVLYDDVVG